MPLTIVNQDITTMTVDTIVNVANTALQMGGIFGAAGASD
jgi:O-acetyl-ADP-ribose deacetylase (regulator of RNase III)